MTKYCKRGHIRENNITKHRECKTCLYEASYVRNQTPRYKYKQMKRDLRKAIKRKRELISQIERNLNNAQKIRNGNGKSKDFKDRKISD